MNKTRKIIGLIVDLCMYILLLVQILYVFEGNDLHEWLGIFFFIFLIMHIIIKRRWFRQYKPSMLKNKKTTIRIFCNILIWLLMGTSILFIFSSMTVSRTIFPKMNFFGDPLIHRILFTAVLTLAFVHGGMHGYFYTKKKKRYVIMLTIIALGCIYLGMGLVPYLNRHFRVVNVDLTDAISSNTKNSSLASNEVNTNTISAKTTLAVYFTRVGNTNFEEDVDAVSGASLILSNHELIGNTELMAKMVQNELNCDVTPITLTEYKYPSSYSETCKVGGQELKENARPKINPIDVTNYDTIILVYPIWWSTIPTPVATFLEENDFTGKTVYLLATQGSSGFASSTKDIKNLIPNAIVKEGLSIYCDDVPTCREQIGEWLRSTVN